jgi:hypothetical protein
MNMHLSMNTVTMPPALDHDTKIRLQEEAMDFTTQNPTKKGVICRWATSVG